MISAILLGTAAQSAVVDELLQDVLKDYDSAKIEMVIEPRDAKRTYYCGLLQRKCKDETYDVTIHCYRINAKNSYGAYTGWEYYWFWENDGRILKYGSGEADYTDSCGRRR